MQQLNPEQQAAVEHLGSPLLVLAGAGSGKTRVITHKIAWLIRDAGYRPYHITAITFTNKAAKEMKSRVAETLRNDETEGLTVATFHRLGLNIIRQESKALGFKSGFTIFDAQDSHHILKELAHRGTTENDEEEEEYNKQAKWLISKWKNDLILPEQAMEFAETPEDLKIAKLYKKYQRQLKAYNAVDFDDLIMLPVLLFRQHPDIKEKWDNRTRYLLVDEYQDTNACQYELVKQLTGVRGELTVVGDDDQSIYAWRGAKPENINQLKTDFPRLRVVKLEQNYRSTEHILKAANHLIANNPHLIEKALWSSLGEGEKIRIMPCRTVEHECEKVVSEMMSIHFRESKKWNNFAILYRSNHQSRLLERYLRENHIDYKITGGTSFFEHAEIKDMLAYMRLIVNPNDDAAFLRVINTPKRGIGVATLEKLGDYANQRDICMFHASTEVGFNSIASTQAKQRFAYFHDWIEELTRDTLHTSPQQIVLKIISDTSYEDWLRNNAKTPNAAKRSISNIMELVDWVRNLHDDGNGKQEMVDIVSHMTLVDRMERNAEEEEREAVTLMTLHSAKGLEFPYVFMVGVEEDILPHQNSMEDESGIEEERRLAYVGITRAKQRLFISYAKTRSRYGESISCDPSRFLDELPEEHIEWEDKRVIDPKEEEATAQAYLSDLQRFLDD